MDPARTPGKTWKAPACRVVANGPRTAFTAERESNRNFNTGVELVLHPARDLDRFPFDGGFGASQPFDTDRDGFPDSFGNGTFNTPPLVEAADTPPFFHNNVAATLEEAVSFYSTDT